MGREDQTIGLLYQIFSYIVTFKYFPLLSSANFLLKDIFNCLYQVSDEMIIMYFKHSALCLAQNKYVSELPTFSLQLLLLFRGSEL